MAKVHLLINRLKIVLIISSRRLRKPSVAICISGAKSISRNISNIRRYSTFGDVPEIAVMAIPLRTEKKRSAIISKIAKNICRLKATINLRTTWKGRTRSVLIRGARTLFELKTFPLRPRPQQRAYMVLEVNLVIFI